LAKKQKQREGPTDDTLEPDEPEEPVATKRQRTTKDGRFVPKVSGNVWSDEEQSGDEHKHNSLIVKEKGLKPSISKRAAMWFSQDLFKELGDEEEFTKTDIHEDENMEDVSDEEEEQTEQRKGSDSDSEEIKKAMQVKQLNKSSTKKKGKKDAEDSNSEFEEVPVESDLDEEDQAKALAIGTVMMNDKNLKLDMMDNSYNRYAFNDQELPSWFADDENQHNTPQLPVTKDMVEEMKRQFLELNARPIKKVAEAKARKKMRAAKSMEQVKSKVMSIADSSDMTTGQKAKALEQLYKKQKKPKPKEKQYVVSRKFQKGKNMDGVQRQKGKRIHLVDSRLKKDNRNQRQSDKSKKRKR